MTGPAQRLRKLFKAGRAATGGGSAGNPPQKRLAQRQTGPRWADAETGSEAAADRAPLRRSRPGEGGRRAGVTSYYFWGALAFVGAAAAIVSVGLQVWPDGRTEAVDENTFGPDPLMALQPVVREALLAPSPELSAELKRGFLGKPDALCDELGALGLANRGWRRAPFQKRRWQCASDLVALTTPSVDYGSTTLFFLLRGPSEDKVDYLRLKLVVEDPRQKQIGLDAVWLVIDALAGRYGWTVPDAFREAVAGFERLETRHHGVQLSVAPEDPSLTDDPLASGRLNIIMNFGEPDLIRPADRFEQSPPLESGWSARDRDGREGE